MQRRARRRGDEARRPQDEPDAEPDIVPDEAVEPERIKDRADQRTGTAKNSMTASVSGLPMST